MSNNRVDVVDRLLIAFQIRICGCGAASSVFVVKEPTSLKVMDGGEGAAR